MGRVSQEKIPKLKEIPINGQKSEKKKKPQKL